MGPSQHKGKRTFLKVVECDCKTTEMGPDVISESAFNYFIFKFTRSQVDAIPFKTKEKSSI